MNATTFDQLRIGQSFRFPEFSEVLKKVGERAYAFESGNAFDVTRRQAQSAVAAVTTYA